MDRRFEGRSEPRKKCLCSGTGDEPADEQVPDEANDPQRGTIVALECQLGAPVGRWPRKQVSVHRRKCRPKPPRLPTHPRDQARPCTVRTCDLDRDGNLEPPEPATHRSARDEVAIAAGGRASGGGHELIQTNMYRSPDVTQRRSKATRHHHRSTKREEPPTGGRCSVGSREWSHPASSRSTCFAAYRSAESVFLQTARFICSAFRCLRLSPARRDLGGPSAAMLK